MSMTYNYLRNLAGVARGEIISATPELDWLAFELAIANRRYAKLRSLGRLKGLSMIRAAHEEMHPLWATFVG